MQLKLQRKTKIANMSINFCTFKFLQICKLFPNYDAFNINFYYINYTIFNLSILTLDSYLET